MQMVPPILRNSTVPKKLKGLELPRILKRPLLCTLAPEPEPSTSKSVSVASVFENVPLAPTYCTAARADADFLKIRATDNLPMPFSPGGTLLPQAGTPNASAAATSPGANQPPPSPARRVARHGACLSIKFLAHSWETTAAA